MAEIIEQKSKPNLTKLQFYTPQTIYKQEDSATLKQNTYFNKYLSQQENPLSTSLKKNNNSQHFFDDIIIDNSQLMTNSQQKNLLQLEEEQKQKEKDLRKSKILKILNVDITDEEQAQVCIDILQKSNKNEEEIDFILRCLQNFELFKQNEPQSPKKQIDLSTIWQNKHSSIQLVKGLQHISIAKRHCVFEMGEIGHSYYILLKGRAFTLIPNDNRIPEQIDLQLHMTPNQKLNDEDFIKKNFSNMKNILELYPGSGFGEIALLTKSKRTATIVAMEKSDFMTLSKQVFDRIINIQSTNMIKEKMDFLLRFAFFQDLQDGQIQWILKQMKIMNLKKKDIVFDEKFGVNNIYFIRSGEVTLSKTNQLFSNENKNSKIKDELTIFDLKKNYSQNSYQEQAQIIYALLGPNTCFGEQEFLEEKKIRESKAQVYSEQCEILSLPCEKLLDIFRKNQNCQISFKEQFEIKQFRYTAQIRKCLWAKEKNKKQVSMTEGNGQNFSENILRHKDLGGQEGLDIYQGGGVLMTEQQQNKYLHNLNRSTLLKKYSQFLTKKSLKQQQRIQNQGENGKEQQNEIDTQREFTCFRAECDLILEAEMKMGQNLQNGRKQSIWQEESAAANSSLTQRENLISQNISTQQNTQIKKNNLKAVDDSIYGAYDDKKNDILLRGNKKNKFQLKSLFKEQQEKNFDPLKGSQTQRTHQNKLDLKLNQQGSQNLFLNKKSDFIKENYFQKRLELINQHQIQTKFFKRSKSEDAFASNNSFNRNKELRDAFQENQIKEFQDQIEINLDEIENSKLEPNLEVKKQFPQTKNEFQLNNKLIDRLQLNKTVRHKVDLEKIDQNLKKQFLKKKFQTDFQKFIHQNQQTETNSNDPYHLISPHKINNLNQNNYNTNTYSNYKDLEKFYSQKDLSKTNVNLKLLSSKNKSKLHSIHNSQKNNNFNTFFNSSSNTNSNTNLLSSTNNQFNSFSNQNFQNKNFMISTTNNNQIVPIHFLSPQSTQTKKIFFN